MPGSATRAPLVSWLGGAIFVGSLGYFLWTFFVRFSRTTSSGPVLAPLVIDIVLFSLFALHHSLLARSGIKAWLTRYVPARLERTLYVWVASLLFILVCVCWQDIPGLLYHHAGVSSVPHWLALSLGGWLIVRAAGIIDPLELAGIRQARGDIPAPQFKATGPYRLVRHPIYLGWMLVVFGPPAMTGTRLAFAVISSAYLIVAIPFEERSLVQAFGDAYSRYRAIVRWRIAPGLW